ncbi:uncharacterized protein [Nerophis lumbriciformis]|uniref:uncharacterized protein n=1 Tax=Nerophis lumbriciformis TaxID=546530 RepID=UPI003BACB8C6
MSHTEALSALLKSQAELQVLTKLSGEDDVEAYLELFERTAARKKWPVAEWGSILAPFLTGEAQRVCSDLALADAQDFKKLKKAILDSQRCSLPARAQQYHNWTFQPTQPPRQQVAALLRLTHRWLTTEGNPPSVDRLVIDRCIRALPPDARKYAAQVSPLTVEQLVALLENYQVSMERLRATRMETARATGEEKLGRDRRRAAPPAPSPPRPQGAAPERPSRAPHRKCYVCGHPDHMSWACPERDRDVSMATAPSSDAGKPCLHTGSGRRQHASLPVKIGGTDAHALLDSGSAVTLVHVDLAGPLSEDTVPVTCVHGDVRQYPVSHIHVQTPRGNALVTAGVVPNLAVPLLIGSDCVLFGRYWTPSYIPSAVPRQRRHRNNGLKNMRPLAACPAFRPLSEAPRSDSSAEEERRDSRKEEEEAEEEGDPFVEFPVPEESINQKTGEFATAQWNDQNLSWARQQVVEIDGQKCEGVSALNSPYFLIKNGLLYRGVLTKGRDIIEQLLVPKSYIFRVLYLAHTHQLGAHLGVQKTYDRIITRFYWPGVKRAIEDFCKGCPECQKNAPRPTYRNPLVPLPIISTPFSRLAMDIVGPLPKSARGHRYILTDGLVERFNCTLKKMLKKVADEDGKDWDHLIPYVLFAIREVPQASTGFSPFELVYGRRPRGVLDIAKETWENQPSPHRSVIDHVAQLQARARKLWPMVREHMEKAQRERAKTYNRGATLREFQVGEKVLVLVPSSECKFLARWQGPYEVIERMGPVNYKTTPPVPIGEDLSPSQKQEVKELLGRNQDRLSELPGRTQAIKHDIETKPGKVIRQRPYRIPEARRAAIKEEVKKMLELGVIEESHSPWSSPIVIVPKPDGSLRFCNDFRKLNEISLCDAYPMPRVDELIERLGPARFVSTLDLTKGYWQVPLTERAKPKTAFSTPEGLFQYTVLPFGIHGAPATFQRMMDRVLRPHQEYAAAYLDDIVIHSTSWSLHLQHLDAVLGALRRAGLTVNAKKCRVGLTETDYLGYTIGRGCVKPQARKVERIREWPRPLTKKQVKSFIGLVSYYQKFIKNFSTIATPLYELTRNKLPHHVTWTAEAETAFKMLKKALCEEPVLKAPDFSQPFILHTDASGTGIGAVLAQLVDGEEHPVTFISRKLQSHERNYATVEKECLAVKWAIHHLRYYLWGRTFTLVTDHAPLKWMSTNKDRNDRVTRWFLELQNYHFTVEYRPGKAIPHADAMSRLYEEDKEAPGPTGELRGGICGVSLKHRLTGRHLTGEEPGNGGRVEQGRQRPSLGRIIEGRYIPLYLLNQPEVPPAVRPGGAQLQTLLNSASFRSGSPLCQGRCIRRQ